ncbi:hypothetical protein EG328_008207 [Venturia inaequalis]|uniref:Swiss Army Knife RNA repair protein HAD domain-containing protein n=1 Tax=Venturia inaequalis TaxID=5025 RepID=A0A8H3Z9Y9_VENIN|nr:hypothetical protein EG328_008207 [Venturia inaequalis]
MPPRTYCCLPAQLRLAKRFHSTAFKLGALVVLNRIPRQQRVLNPSIMVGNYAQPASNGTPPNTAYTPTALKRWSCDEDHPLPPVSQIKAIHIYDFDNTLFASPLPNTHIWDQSSKGTLMSENTLVNGGWFHDNRILGATGEGIEKEEPKAWEGWWNEHVAKLCELSHEQNDAFSVLLTGRGEMRFADLIKRMLKSKGLSFDMVCLKPATGPANQTFRSTMNFKQTLLTDIVNTYHEAEEIKIYEDRPGHVQQFQDFFSDFNRDLMGPNPRSQRRTIACDVIEIATKAAFLDPVVEIAEVQKMINDHNIVYKSGNAPSRTSPLQLESKTLSASYLVKSSDVDRLAALMPAIARNNPSVRILANNIRITLGAPSPQILQSVGGIGKRVRFRVTGLGVFDNRIWAASVEPVPSNEKFQVLDRPPAIVLGMHQKSSFRELNQIQQWTPIPAAQAIEFETTVGEKVSVSIVSENHAYNRVGQNNRKRPYDNDGTQQDFTGMGNSGLAPQGSNKRGNVPANYRGGNQNRGRGRDRRDEGGRGGRGRGGHQRGGGGNGNYGRGGRGGRGGGQQQHHRQSGDDFGAQRSGYTDYDAAGGRNDGGSGMYNAY